MTISIATTATPIASLRRLARRRAISSPVTASGVYANLAGGSFEGNDGNLAVNTPGNTDWANVAGLNVGIDQPSGSTDIAFGQDTKEDNASVTVVDGSIPPNKNGLTRFYEASAEVGGQNFLDLCWERAVNIGNPNLDFEIDQKIDAGFTGTTTGPVTPSAYRTWPSASGGSREVDHARRR